MLTGRWLRVAIVSSLPVAVGCQQQAAPPVTPAEQQAKAAHVESAADGEVTRQPELKPTRSEDSAEAAFLQILMAFQQGRFDHAFEMLPNSYQTDLTELVHEFAGQMDGGIWSRSFELLAKVGNILKNRKTLILSLENVRNSPQIAAFRPYWDSVADGLQDLAESDVADLQQLKQADLKLLLSKASDRGSGLPFPKFADVTVSTVKADGDTATLVYRETAQGEPREVQFIRVQGKWLPRSLAEGWPSAMAHARKTLAGLPDLIASAKPQALQNLDDVSKMLDQLQSAQTAEEFNRAIVPLIMAMKFGSVWAEQSLQELASGRRKGSAVQLVFDRELTDNEFTQLQKAVQSEFEDSVIDYEMSSGDGRTRCRFNPVPDRDRLAELLQRHFPGAEVHADSATQALLVELK